MFYRLQILKLHGELITCKSLLYSENPYGPIIPPDYKNRFELKPLELIEYDELLELLPLPETHDIRDSFISWLAKDITFLLNLFLNVDFIANSDKKQLSKLPNTLNNVRFLGSNHQEPYLFVDKDEPITVLSVTVTSKDK